MSISSYCYYKKAVAGVRGVVTLLWCKVLSIAEIGNIMCINEASMLFQYLLRKLK